MTINKKKSGKSGLKHFTPDWLCGVSEFWKWIISKKSPLFQYVSDLCAKVAVQVQHFITDDVICFIMNIFLGDGVENRQKKHV